MATHDAKKYFAYQKDINTEMKALYGVSYAEVKSDLHDDTQFFKNGFENNIPAKELAKNIGYQSGFLTVDENVAGYAADYNLRKAALLQFASENKEWRRGNDGTLFLPYEGGIATLIPAYDSYNSEWAFKAELREGASLSDTLLKMENFGSVEKAYNGNDIGVSSEWVKNNVNVIDLDNLPGEDEAPSPRF